MELHKHCLERTLVHVSLHLRISLPATYEFVLLLQLQLALTMTLAYNLEQKAKPVNERP